MNFQHIFSHHPKTSYFFFNSWHHVIHRFLSLHQWHGDVSPDAGAQLCYIAKPPEPNWEKNYWTMYNECANNCLRYDLMGLSPTVTDTWTWIVYAGYPFLFFIGWIALVSDICCRLYDSTRTVIQYIGLRVCAYCGTKYHCGGFNLGMVHGHLYPGPHITAFIHRVANTGKGLQLLPGILNRERGSSPHTHTQEQTWAGWYQTKKKDSPIFTEICCTLYRCLWTHSHQS